GGIAVAVAAAAVLLLVLRTSGEKPTQVACGGSAGFAFTAQGGTVACGGTPSERGVLPVGGVLDTGTNNAELTIADIGTAQLFEGTRVRLDRTEADQRHQIHLERGRMHAIVTAPPRMFAVTTPGTSVIDLGCEYTIEIDANGQGSIAVQSGKVELESGSEALIVAPAGTSTRLLAGRRPSLPIADGANDLVRAAVADFERGDLAAIDRLLAAAQPVDAITIANLVVLAPLDRRAAIFARLAVFVPPPEGVTAEMAVSTPAQANLWREEVIVTHLGEQALDKQQKKFPPKR
ncbi:MAG: FecR domain-containing protein, partial [Deltaproteobacteria bacterium]|nr:FecR domain-containing protein [Deltaproteobacteria bacterium]